MAIVFDHNHVFNQSPFLPELSPALNSPPPYANYQDHAAGRLLFSDQFAPHFPSNSPQQPFSQTGAAQFAVAEDVGSGPPIPSCHVGELEKLVYSNTASLDDGMQFLYEENGSKNDNNGLISDLDWGEMSSLISAPLLYPSVAHDLMIGSSYLEQQKL